MQKLAEICIRRPVFAAMIILALVVVGASSYFRLGVDRFPSVDLPTVAVRTVLPGSSTEETEVEVSQRIEEAVNTVEGIQELRSVTSGANSIVIATFDLSRDIETAAQDIRDRVSGVIRQLPEDVQPPIVSKFNNDSSPIYTLALSANRPLRELTEIADKQIKVQIERAAGVGEVAIVGGLERAISVTIDADRLAAYNLPITVVRDALRNQNTAVPGGNVTSGSREMALRTLGRVADPQGFGDLVVAVAGGRPVRIRDLGEATDGTKEQRSVARLNGVPTVTLEVRRQSGANTVAVIDGVNAILERIKPQLPSDVKVQPIRDQSRYIRAALHEINLHLILGSLFASLVVFAFMRSWRSTVIAAVAIPTSVIATFGMMKALDFTLNSVTMLALVLMVGVVIDDAIVVLENIFRFIDENWMNPFQAAIEGTREIGLAVLATSLSLMAVFVPIGFMQGIVGKFMSSFGLTASFAVGVSLIVSFTLTPMLAARLIKRKKIGKTDENDEVVHHESGDESVHAHILDEEASSHYKGWFRHVDGVYTWLLRFSMGHRWVIVTLCALVFLAIIPLFMFVGKNFLPVDDQSQFEVSVRAPEGYSLSATSQLLERIASEIRKMNGVTDTLVTVGGGQQQVVNAGSIYVKLTDIHDRPRSQELMMADTRDLLKNFPPELRTAVQQVAAFSGGGFRNANVQFLLSGPDLKKLEEYSTKVLEKMKTIPDAVDVDSTLIGGKPEVQLDIDRDTAADLGVRVGDISQALNTLVAGQEATTYNVGTDQYEVRVRAINPFRTSVEGLNRLIVPSSKVGWVTLDRVVTAKPGTGPSAVDRTNRQRQVTLLANTRPGGSAANITSAIDSYVKSLNLPPEYKSGYVGQSKEMGKAGFYFLLAFALSFVFMYIVLAAQFESFIHPVTILLTLPLSIPFGIVSLLIAGQTVNIFSGLGLLLLFGVVKKNAILQIDHTNGLRSRGMNRYDAIIQANRDRLRPILMTTIALVAGMLPLVVSSGAGSGTNRSIGVLVVGGQTLCLLLTLLAVPVFYSIFDDLSAYGVFRRVGQLSERIFGGIRRKVATATSSLLGKN